MKGGKEAENTSLPEEPECKGAFSSISSCGYDEAAGSGDTMRRQCPARTDPSEGHTSHQAGPRRHSPGAGGGGPPRKRLYPGFPAGKGAVHANRFNWNQLSGP